MAGLAKVAVQTSALATDPGQNARYLFPFSPSTPSFPDIAKLYPRKVQRSKNSDKRGAQVFRCALRKHAYRQLERIIRQRDAWSLRTFSTANSSGLCKSKAAKRWSRLRLPGLAVCRDRCRLKITVRLVTRAVCLSSNAFSVAAQFISGSQNQCGTESIKYCSRGVSRHIAGMFEMLVISCFEDNNSHLINQE